MTLYRFFLPALLMDMAIYLDLYAMELQVKGLGGTAADLAILTDCYLVVYILLCPLTTRLAERVGRDPLIGGAGVLFALVSFVSVEASTLGNYFLLAAVLGFLSACYWPLLQAELGEMVDPAHLSQELGTFNLAWTIGKGLGLTTQGVLFELVSPNAPYWLAGVCGLMVSILFVASTLMVRRAALQPPPVSPDSDDPGAGPLPTDRAGDDFWVIGLMLNFVVWGANTAIIALFPSLADPVGIGLDDPGGPTRQGWCLGAMFVGQFIGFWLLKRWTGWTFSKGLVLLCFGVLAVASVGMYYATTWVMLTVPLSLYGLGLGFSYYSSILYSLSSKERPARKVSVHEATLASGALLLPLLAGGAAELSGDPRAPYLVLAGLLGASMLVVPWLGRSRRD